MKKHFLFLCCLFLSGSLASAQEQKPPRKGQGYVFVAPGAVTERGHSVGIMHFGVGGEGMIYRGLGIGGEIGYLFASACTGCGMGLGSVNAYYQFNGAGSSKRVVPFITGGLSVAVGSGGLGGGLNLGGGIYYWLRPRLGLRMEFRDHIPPQAPGSHLWEARLGVSF